MASYLKWGDGRDSTVTNSLFFFCKKGANPYPPPPPALSCWHDDLQDLIAILFGIKGHGNTKDKAVQRKLIAKFIKIF